MVIWRYTPDGDLDTTFGTNGIVVHDGAAGQANSIDAGRSLAIDSFGRILVVGVSRNTAGNDDMVIWRYTPDGDLDTTFGEPDGLPGVIRALQSITVHQGQIAVTPVAPSPSTPSAVSW